MHIDSMKDSTKSSLFVPASDQSVSQISSATAARLSVDLLAFQIASPGLSSLQRLGQVSGRLAP
jgi:hypothetical protein